MTQKPLIKISIQSWNHYTTYTSAYVVVRKMYVAQTCRQVVIFLILIKLFLDLKVSQGSLNLVPDEPYGSSPKSYWFGLLPKSFFSCFQHRPLCTGRTYDRRHIPQVWIRIPASPHAYWIGLAESKGYCCTFINIGRAAFGLWNCFELYLSHCWESKVSS